ncbi:hypothetical protein FNV43_RR26961 [Rhamnella rubrinervis]|uniref:ABC transporter domain-containing protein n=1 Tax=Rhamnella rubrinervis TaxID=2594499 RepID=A0A8K0GK54_9ROSA|nr:hypothetical protein FNV43_RR26961 [Rhamnella rubrinervis]
MATRRSCEMQSITVAKRSCPKRRRIFHPSKYLTPAYCKLHSFSSSRGSRKRKIGDMGTCGGKRVGQMVVGFGGSGFGQALAAVAVAFLLRLLSGPGPALSPETETVEDGSYDQAEDGEDDTEVAGEVIPVAIRWRNITCSLSNKSSKSVRFLLKDVTGEAKPGRLLAIMGPSGSGKTTLLNVLAGQLTASPQLRLSGLLEVNGKSSSNKAYKYAYVRQEDLFFSQLTVRETLSLAAELQLPETSSVEARDEYVNNLLFKLGLVSCADSIVGDAKVRGISGGEKKRLSLACELIASPSVIFADEPTTGLDAFQAEKVMETLQQLAQDGHTVICSIHQPRGSVYSKFDDIVLLADGSLVYAGPARDKPLAYFSKFGTIGYADEEIERQNKMLKSISNGSQEMNCTQASRDGPTNKVRARMSIASAVIFGSVFGEWAGVVLEVLLLVAAINTAMAALTKTVGVFPKERAIVDRERLKGSYALGPYLLSKLLAEIPIGAAFPLMFGAVLYPMARLHPALSRFGRFCGIVTVESFAASAMGLTVGAMVPTTEAAMAVGPSLMTVFIVFGGYYVNSENTPIIFRWIPRVSLIRWAFQGLCINEFSGLQLIISIQLIFRLENRYLHSLDNGNTIRRLSEYTSFEMLAGWRIRGTPPHNVAHRLNESEMDTKGKGKHQALERLSFGGSRIRDTVVAQCRILLFWYYTTYLLLVKNKPKYQQLEAPPVDQVEPPPQLEPSKKDQFEKHQPNESPTINEVEPIKQLESPAIDQIRPFILEGAK